MKTNQYAYHPGATQQAPKATRTDKATTTGLIPFGGTRAAGDGLGVEEAFMDALGVGEGGTMLGLGDVLGEGEAEGQTTSGPSTRKLSSL